MVDFFNNRIPIRLRLTLWYVFLFAVTFIAFSVYLLFEFQHSLRKTIDSSLQITVTNAIAAIDKEDFVDTGTLTFNPDGQSDNRNPVFGMRLISAQNEVWDSFGTVQNISFWGPTEAGYSTQTGSDGEDQWRIFSQPVLGPDGQTVAWVQAAQSLGPVTDTLEDLRGQLFLGIPFIILLAGLGGYFLADQALRPIRQITTTAQEITAQDLSRRLAYRGAMDEIGSLARTFDGMLERLQSSFERERRFTSDAAHELRTPLTVLKGQIEVTLSRHRTSLDHEKKLQELSGQVERLIRLSNGLLFLSRSDQQELPFEPSDFYLREWLEILVEQLEPLAHEKVLTINIDIPAELSVYGDSDHLIRLFVNILENAIKYTPVGGQIAITALEGPDEIQVNVQNTGPGIPPEHLPYLFERFYRADSDRSSQTGGTGLGLAIAREIVRLHRGDIDVHSEPGRGVMVTVHLPIEDRSTVSKKNG